MADVLIIGNGAAGRKAAETIRKGAPNASILMVTDEPFPFYPRPKLSLGFMSGEIKKDDIFLKPDFYSRNAVSLLFGRIERVDAEARVAMLRGGSALNYNYLLFASGAVANKPRWPGSELDGVVTLRTLADAEDILRRAEGQSRIVVAGAGILGVEAAEALCKRGASVSLLVRGGKDKVGAPALKPDQAENRCDSMIKNGVNVELDDEVERFEGSESRLERVVTKCGAVIHTGLAIATIGASPDLRFLEGSAIKTARGIVVDSELRTSTETAFAAGDCAETSVEGAEKQQYGSPYMNAMKQGEYAGAKIAELLNQ
ncbi:MAG TPA: FAD-dependent oxidoreductase [bacterium]|nr:FAD-dependent oxidoreductase [bacterium]